MYKYGWYDFQIRVADIAGFERCYAGHFENGYSSFSDPAMGTLGPA
jgi:phospholipase C